jgi:hypothetical protein
MAQTCFYHLRWLRSVRRQMGRKVTTRLVYALVLSSLDYCNAVLAGIPASTLATLQRVLERRSRDHVSSALKALHWLPISQRINYKLCMNTQSINRTSTSIFDGHVGPMRWRFVESCSSLTQQRRLRYSSKHSEVRRKSFLGCNIKSLELSANNSGNNAMYRHL